MSSTNQITPGASGATSTNQLTPGANGSTYDDQINSGLKATMYLLMEDNSSKIKMEDASGFILLETSYSAPTTVNQIT
jgi:hypothetical protein